MYPKNEISEESDLNINKLHVLTGKFNTDIKFKCLEKH